MNATTIKLERTLAVFAHELREPLSSILLAAQAMADTATDSGVCQELGGLIARQGRYLAKIIDGVLETPYRDSGAIGLHKEWFDLARVIDEAAETVQPILRERRHGLAVSLPERPIYLCADPLRVQQVLVNLLNNAAKYTEPGGSIRVVVEGTNERLDITVRDNGTGISAELLPRVFGWFEQAGVRLPDARYSGLGIGLAVVRSLVEAHGGAVSARSDGPGKGSAFTVQLPVFTPEPPGRFVSASVPAEPASMRRSAMVMPMLDA